MTRANRFFVKFGIGYIVRRKISQKYAKDCPQPPTIALILYNRAGGVTFFFLLSGSVKSRADRDGAARGAATIEQGCK